MPAYSLFDIHQVIESQHKSQFATSKGWLKETLVLKFDWVGETAIRFIIQALLNYYKYVPSTIPVEWIVFSLGEPTESSQDTRRSTQSPNALRQHLHRQKLKYKKQLSAIKILLNYPLKLLQTLEKQRLGVPTQDYGGQFEVLQFNGASGLEGKVTLGIAYENDQKVKAYGRKRCIKSEEQLLWLEHIQRDLLGSQTIEHDTSHLRCQFIKGARTMQHTDSFRGNMESYLMPLGVDFALYVKLWPNFKCSVIEIDGFQCIPFLFDSDGLCVLNFDVFQGSNKFRKILYPREALGKAKPIGDLPFVAVAPKGDGLQIAPMKYQIESSPKNYPVISMEEAKLRMIPNKSFPTKNLQVIKKQFEWGSFIAWRNIHWANGDFSCPRLSIFFRPLRENPTGANMSNTVDLR
jgi:hypothetical protein